MVGWLSAPRTFVINEEGLLRDKSSAWWLAAVLMYMYVCYESGLLGIPDTEACA